MLIKRKQYQSGFSLIEFIVILVIISILSLLAMPKFLNYTKQAKLAQIKNDERIIFRKIQELETKELINDKDFNNLDVLIRNNQINPKYIDKWDTQLDINEFYYIEDEDRVEYRGKGSTYITTYLDHKAALAKYDIKDDNGEITVRGFKKGYNKDVQSIEDLKHLEYNDKKIVRFGRSAFSEDNIIGRFPELNHLKKIGNNSFVRAKFEGTFPKLNSLESIGSKNFQNASFTGNFPQLNNLKEIKDYAFEKSNFSGNFPELEKLSYIGKNSLYNSNFNNIPNDFYQGWNVKNEWTK